MALFIYGFKKKYEGFRKRFACTTYRETSALKLSWYSNTCILRLKWLSAMVVSMVVDWCNGKLPASSSLVHAYLINSDNNYSQ